MQEERQEDFALLAQFNEGSEEAFTRLVERHSGSLFNFVYRIIPENTEAEDIAQEVFLKIAGVAKRLRERAKFSTYLYHIAYNLCIDRIRRRSVRAARASFVSLDEAAGSDSGENPGKQVPDPTDLPADLLRERLETKHSVEKALSELPENQRAAIMLKVYESRSYAEIAEILGVSVPSVESLLFRARQNLKTRLMHEFRAPRRPPQDASCLWRKYAIL